MPKLFQVKLGARVSVSVLVGSYCGHAIGLRPKFWQFLMHSPQRRKGVVHIRNVSFLRVWVLLSVEK